MIEHTSSPPDKQAMTARTQEKSDWLLAGGLAVATLLSRLPFRSQLLYEHDSFLFARAMQRYSVAEGRPHPPGYLFYVMAARLMNGLVHDPNAALVGVNILFSALGAAGCYFLARRLWNRSAGLAAGLLFASSPLIWFHGDIALIYATAGALAALVMLGCFRLADGQRGWAIPTALLLGVSGGFWTWVTIFLFPAWAYAASRGGWRRVATGLVWVLVGALTWYLPNAVLAGGIGAFQRMLSTYGRPVIVHGLLTGWEWPRSGPTAVNIGRWIWAAAQLALVPLGYLAVRGAVQAARGRFRSGREAWLFGLWIGPALLFYLFIYVDRPGYILIFAPALLILAAGGIVALGQDLWSAARGRAARSGSARYLVLLLIALAAVDNAIAFAYRPTDFSAAKIDAHDRVLKAKIDFVESFLPGETVVLASDEAAAAEYYLYEQAGYEVRNASFNQRTLVAPDTPGPAERVVRYVILFDDQLLDYNRSPGEVRWRELIPGSGIMIRYFALERGQRFVLRPGEFWVETAAGASP